VAFSFLLTATVQKLVVEGHVPPRSAQEIARLPDDVQVAFAVSAINEFLSKENVTRLVNRYLNEDTGPEERNRIIRAPKLALPNELKRRSARGRDNSDSVRLARAIARCLDDAACLSGLLDRVDIVETAARMPDIIMLSNYLAALRQKMQVIFPQEKT